MQNNLVTASGLAELVTPELLTPDYYVMHYMEFLPRYIADGRPTQDTLRTYQEKVDQFIKWCIERKRHPLAMHDYEMRIYLEWLVNTGHEKGGDVIRLAAIRAFFHAAFLMKLIKENPCKNIHIHRPNIEDEQFLYFSQDQIQGIYKKIAEESMDIFRLRNEAMFLLMAAEGLRVVEVSRMNDEDVDWENSSIRIHGKGHEGTIYPSPLTMKKLSEWLRVRPTKEKEGGRTPTFVSLSDRNTGKRLQRSGIRKYMKKLLRSCGYDRDGAACHVLRHSCGTNLYAQTKDLRVVQETLRQRDPKVTARYAHVQQRMSKRYTNALTEGLED